MADLENPWGGGGPNICADGHKRLLGAFGMFVIYITKFGGAQDPPPPWIRHWICFLYLFQVGFVRYAGYQVGYIVWGKRTQRRTVVVVCVIMLAFDFQNSLMDFCIC